MAQHPNYLYNFLWELITAIFLYELKKAQRGWQMQQWYYHLYVPHSDIIIFMCHTVKRTIRFVQQGLVKFCNWFQYNLPKSRWDVLSDMTVKSSEGNRCYVFCKLTWHLASIVLQSEDKHTPWKTLPKGQCYKHKILPFLSQFNSVHIQPVSLNTWRKQTVHGCYMPCNVLWT